VPALPFKLPHAVTVEALSATTRDASGGSVEAWATLAGGVPCLISQGSGGRPDDLGQDAAVGTYTVTGFHRDLGRQDVRFVVTRGPRAGLTLYPSGGFSAHGPVDLPGLRIPQFYRATCTNRATGAGKEG
jgi:hypothetical protein